MGTFRVRMIYSSLIRCYILREVTFIYVIFKTIFCHGEFVETCEMALDEFYCRRTLPHIPCVLSQVINAASRLTSGRFDVSIRTNKVASLIHDKHTALWAVLNFSIFSSSSLVKYTILEDMCSHCTIGFWIKYQI